MELDGVWMTLAMERVKKQTRYQSCEMCSSGRVGKSRGSQRLSKERTMSSAVCCDVMVGEHQMKQLHVWSRGKSTLYCMYSSTGQHGAAHLLLWQTPETRCFPIMMIYKYKYHGAHCPLPIARCM